jgi:hypothetical protein
MDGFKRRLNESVQLKLSFTLSLEFFQLHWSQVYFHFYRLLMKHMSCRMMCSGRLRI